jgi:acetyl-CoA synthetase
MRKSGNRHKIDGIRVVVADTALLKEMARLPDTYEPATRADDLAVFQYTSGTTRELPAAVKHSHRAIVTLMFAALYGTGIRPGDEFFCPSSPAWGHGLWHGTLAPLALGVSTGTFRRPLRCRASDEGACKITRSRICRRRLPTTG